MERYLIKNRESENYSSNVPCKDLKNNTVILKVFNKKTSSEYFYMLEYAWLSDYTSKVIAYRFNGVETYYCDTFNEDGEYELMCCDCLCSVEKSFEIYIKQGACCHLSLPYSSHHICGEYDFASYVELLKLSYYYTNLTLVKEFGEGITEEQSLDLFNKDEYEISIVITKHHNSILLFRDWDCLEDIDKHQVLK